MDRIAFTGHRHLRVAEVAPALAAIHARYPDAIWITGGAIRLDSHAAEYARDELLCPAVVFVLGLWGG